jgi:hypothetical protein
MGNEAVPHDELSVELLTPHIRQRILRRLGAFSSGATFLIEKTVENCVRVPYVQAVFPDARYIHLIRDGRDVVESVYREWTRPPDWGYILKKVRTYPLTDAFDYAVSYAGSTLWKAIAYDRTQVPDPWGARYLGIHEDLATKDLLEVCAIQWACSVGMSLAALARLPAERVLTIRYEAFVQHPGDYLRQIAQFAGFDPSPYSQFSDLESVSRNNIGKGRRCLNEQQQSLVLPHIQDKLVFLGYMQYAHG